MRIEDDAQTIILNGIEYHLVPKSDPSLTISDLRDMSLSKYLRNSQNKELFMEDIIESIINGQRKQALKQLQASPFLLDDLFEELLNLGMCEEIITMYRIAVSQGYITF